ncbi:hypothetical protein PU02_0287 [Bartonella ancashensis]|uniref:Uncharacterized protein n=1 Tax=Bartonella ancashensis TaxID=1318743 RepID=A0A0M3T2M4_9HYPH|nr:hypothetical protein PU02_0287 [Bartonella ancashensis]
MERMLFVFSKKIALFAHHYVLIIEQNMGEEGERDLPEVL